MNFRLISVVSMAFVATCCGHIGRGQLSYQELGPQVYCGRILARTIAVLCYGQPINEKLSEGTMYNAILAPYYKESEQENQVDWWMPPHKARSLGFAPRNKRLVVNECCDKPCTVNELLAYCI